jgi:enoyl-CoA hydratase
MSSGKKRQYVNWDSNEGVAIITLSNGALNVLNGQVSLDLSECANEIRDDLSVRAVVITGAGELAFSAGGDIKEFPKVLQGTNAKQFWQNNRLAIEKLACLVQPTIAAINGYAYGGGFEMTLACDLRIASENARFCLPEIKIGLFPDGGGTQRLPRLVGTSRAKKMMFLGEPISAEEAFRIGLIDYIVPVGQALSEALTLAKILAGMPAVALQSIKKAVDKGCNMELNEGLAAFLEKRLPHFKGC